MTTNFAENGELLQKTEKLVAKARETTMRRKAETLEPPSQVQLQLLPILQVDERGMPNALARGALFNAAKASEPRKYYPERTVASLNNFCVEYRGEELRQDDCSVFIALLYFQQSIPLGRPFRFTAYTMLKELGWSINKAEYQHLKDCCKRLSATNLTVSYKDGSAGFAGSLVRDFRWHDETGKNLAQWVVRFEPAIARFFQEDSFSILSPQVRRKISGRAPLAQWLHAFLNSHREPYPISVVRYYELSDSRSKNMGDFRSRLKIALQKLVDAEFLKGYFIKDDIVHVAREQVSFAPPIYQSPILVEVGEGIYDD